MSTCNGHTSTSDGQCDSTNPVTDDEAQIAERLASAKDVAAALTDAAEATAVGDFESSEAGARAGLSILSISETRQNVISASSLKETLVQVAETGRVGLKWHRLSLKKNMMSKSTAQRPNGTIQLQIISNLRYQCLAQSGLVWRSGSQLLRLRSFMEKRHKMRRIFCL